MPTGIGGVRPGRVMSRALRARAEPVGFLFRRFRVAVRSEARRILPPPVLQEAAGFELGESGGAQGRVQMMNWWMDRGIDGFRMDVITLISKHLDGHGRLPGEVGSELSEGR